MVRLDRDVDSDDEEVVVATAAQINREIAENGDFVKKDETIIFTPFNPLNREITEADVKSILVRYGLPAKVDNMELYKRAFIHRSYLRRPDVENAERKIVIAACPQDCMPLRTKSNERLEFLGDGILDMWIKFLLYRRFPKANEGFMTEKKIALIKNETLGKIVLEMGLNKYYIISRYKEETGFRSNVKKLGCLFEAFLGALFLDFNKMDVADKDVWTVFKTGAGCHLSQKFVDTVFERHIDWTALISNNDNYKTQLQIRIQKTFGVTPTYIHKPMVEGQTDYECAVCLMVGYGEWEIKEKGLVPEPYSAYGSLDAIKTQMTDAGRPVLVLLGEGKHAYKRRAEQIACQCALNVIN